MALSQIFFARQDGANAQNAAINVGNDQAVEIRFESGLNGDRTLDFVADGPDIGTQPDFDPDTQVLIDGQLYNFSYIKSGTLPVASVPSALQGQIVYVIRVDFDRDGDVEGNGDRQYFFTEAPSGTAANMNLIGNGALTLIAPNNAPPPNHVCFCAGTHIATPSGARMVESLVAGDLVLTADGAARQILWVGSTHISKGDLRAHANVRPILIPANAFGMAGPTEDLLVSPQHRVVLDGPLVELMFAKDRVLVPAKHLVGTFAEVTQPVSDVTYFHVLLADHELLVSNGLVTESFQPAPRMIEAMAPHTRDHLLETLVAMDDGAMLTRKDAVISLKAGESHALAHAMLAAMNARASRQTSAALQSA